MCLLGATLDVWCSVVAIGAAVVGSAVVGAAAVGSAVVGSAAVGSAMISATEVGMTSGVRCGAVISACACVLYDAPVVQQWLAQQCVCTQQQLEQQGWVLPVR